MNLFKFNYVLRAQKAPKKTGHVFGVYFTRLRVQERNFFFFVWGKEGSGNPADRGRKIGVL